MSQAANPDEPITAVITGASRGIGFQISKRIASFCSEMWVASKEENRIKEASRHLSVGTSCNVHAFWGNLADGRVVAEQLRSAVADRMERLDLLVHNAGYYVEGTLAEIPDADFEENMRVNCFAAHYIVSALLPLMRKSKRARIVLIGSTAAYEAYPLVPTYGVAKWALRGYALNLRRELMASRIGVTFISPGGTLTDMWEGAELPPKRLLEPDDIAILVETLIKLSPQAVVEELIVRPMLGDVHE